MPADSKPPPQPGFTPLDGASAHPLTLSAQYRKEPLSRDCHVAILTGRK